MQKYSINAHLIPEMQIIHKNAEKYRKIQKNAEKFRIHSSSVFIASVLCPAKSHKKMQSEKIKENAEKLKYSEEKINSKNASMSTSLFRHVVASAI
jgi:hypothetical protein